MTGRTEAPAKKRPGRPRIDGIVGKSELCARLNWSRKRLDNTMRAYPDFPFVVDGSEDGEWRFLLSEVRAYVETIPVTRQADAAAMAKLAKGGRPTQARHKAADEAALRAILKKRDAVPGTPEAEAAVPLRPYQRQAPAIPSNPQHDVSLRIKEAEAGLKEDKLRISRGELVDKSALEMELSQVLAKFGKFLDSLPVTVGKRCNLENTVIRTMREVIDTERRIFVANIHKAASAAPEAIDEAGAEE